MAELKAGMTNEMEFDTTPEMSARKVYPHVPDVYASAAMVGHMETVCADLVRPHLEEGQQTVGTGMNFQHTAPTPLGMKVRLKCEILEAEGRKLKFQVEASDEKGKIGESTHFRFIIDVDKFDKMVADKAAG